MNNVIKYGIPAEIDGRRVTYITATPVKVQEREVSLKYSKLSSFNTNVRENEFMQ